MKAVLVILVLLVVGVAALGFYQGWFLVSSDKTDSNSNVTISVDQGKIKEDKDKAKEKMENIGHQVKEKTVTGDKARDANKVKDADTPSNADKPGEKEVRP